MPYGPEAGLREFYQRHANEVLIPFWIEALDLRYGGVFTCFDNRGEKLVSRDKYTWSQGRFAWVLSRLSDLCSRGLLDGDAEVYLEHAGRIVDFIDRHAILENGSCAFVLSELGEKRESIPGKGYDTSIYADCFVVLGYAEYARVCGEKPVLEKALDLYDGVRVRISEGKARTEPYPIPERHRSLTIPMILLNVSQELAVCAERLKHPRSEELRNRSAAYAAQIMGEFRSEGEAIVELLPEDETAADTMLARHRNPGHSLESMWFVIDHARKSGRGEYVREAVKVIREAIELGWDGEHGGLLRFVDRNGGPPKGRLSGGPYERLIRETWDTKLWWPHSEALYATLLAARASEDSVFYDLYARVHDYVFSVFPNPDRSVGEWIQIRGREGTPVEKVVALPVKDPYHILRNMLLIIELLHEAGETSCPS